MSIVVFSCFDGHSCLRIALRQLGFADSDIEYYASEIDKNAIIQSSKAFPDIIHLGDIKALRKAICWSEKTFTKFLDSKFISDKTKQAFKYRRKLRNLRIDLFAGGSPCQGFSRAGLGLNFDDPRSKLFFEYHKLYLHFKKTNPDMCFFLENVDMDKWCLGQISRLMGVYPVKINSALVSAQNRIRWYWTDVRTKKEGLFAEIHADIPQPSDRKIFLKDILQPEEEIDEKYYMRNVKINFNGMDVNGKANTFRSGGSRSQSEKHNYDLIKVDLKGNYKKDQSKASCYTAGGNSGGYHSDMDLLCVRMVGRKILDGKRADNDDSVPTVQRLEAVKERGKTNCLTTVEKDNLIFVGGIKDGELLDGNSREFPQGNKVYHEEGKAACLSAQMGGQSNGSGLVMIGGIQDRSFVFGGNHSQANRVSVNGKSACLQSEAGGGGAKTGPYLTQKPRGNNKGGRFYDKSPTLTSNSWEHNHELNYDYYIRRLTPLEAQRLQTVPEWYVWYVSDTQIYRMLGNGWTVDVIVHILSYWKLSPKAI